MAVNARKARGLAEGRLGTVIEGSRRAAEFQVAEVCWDEYEACRLAVPFAIGQTAVHSRSMIAVLAEARESARAAILSCRTHGDVRKLIAEAGAPLCSPLRAAAYLFGGMDAEDMTWVDLPQVRSAMQIADFTELLDKLHEALKSLWQTRDDRTSELNAISELEDVIRCTFASAGIYLEEHDDGRYGVEVLLAQDALLG